MCVIIAQKIKRENTDMIPNWFLYKVRDRTYEPEYKIVYDKDGKFESVTISDNHDGWMEGVNSKGIMIVSATLQNHQDKKEGDEPKKRKLNYLNHKKNDQGKTLRKILDSETLEEAVKIIEKNLFEGNTFVSDGRRLFVVEIFLPIKQKERYEKIVLKDHPELETSEDDNKYSDKRRKLRDLVYELTKKEDYEIHIEEVIEDELVVRTNHGIFLKKAGYQPKDGEGYESSMNRRKVVIDTLEDLEINNPFDVLSAVKNLGLEEIHKDPMMRPIRVEPCKYITTTIIMLTPIGTMFAIPMEAKFENININKISEDRGVSFVLLPKNFNLWKTFEDEPKKKLKLKEYFERMIK